MALTTLASTASMRHDVPAATAAPASATENADGDFWGDDGFTFDDVLDIINPLQHIPVVSTLYRAITGDAVSTGARVFGSTLFGGAVFGSVAGLFGAVADAMVKETTGKEIGEHVMALFDGTDSDSQDPNPVLLASASTAADILPGPAPALPAVAEPPADTGENDAEAANDAAETASTPVWLTRFPKAREDYTEMVARAGARTSTDVFLEAISHGLDKYDQTKTALDLYGRRNDETTPANAAIDTIL